MTKLTEEQLKNWRQILFGIVGMYAFIMPDGEVERMKDKMQNQVCCDFGEWADNANLHLGENATLILDEEKEKK